MIAAVLSGLGLAIAAVPLLAVPSAAQTVRTEAHPYYDVHQEVTLRGMVSSVVTKASPGMVVGSHLLLQTESGAVDASLGRWGLRGKGALAVSAGQMVEVTGVKKTLLNREVFVVRSVKSGGAVYTVRNEHGIAVSPQSRQRASQKTARKGEWL
jgi:hypothetical protein